MALPVTVRRVLATLLLPGCFLLPSCVEKAGPDRAGIAGWSGDAALFAPGTETGEEYARNDYDRSVRPQAEPLLASNQWPQPDVPDLYWSRRITFSQSNDSFIFFTTTPRPVWPYYPR